MKIFQPFNQASVQTIDHIYWCQTPTAALQALNPISLPVVVWQDQYIKLHADATLDTRCMCLLMSVRCLYVINICVWLYGQPTHCEMYLYMLLSHKISSCDIYRVYKTA